MRAVPSSLDAVLFSVEGNGFLFPEATEEAQHGVLDRDNPRKKSIHSSVVHNA